MTRVYLQLTKEGALAKRFVSDWSMSSPGVLSPRVSLIRTKDLPPTIFRYMVGIHIHTTLWTPYMQHHWTQYNNTQPFPWFRKVACFVRMEIRLFSPSSFNHVFIHPKLKSSFVQGNIRFTNVTLTWNFFFSLVAWPQVLYSTRAWDSKKPTCNWSKFDLTTPLCFLSYEQYIKGRLVYNI